MPTAGELLARKLRGDTSVTNRDIEQATNAFFESNGISCDCKVVAAPQEAVEAVEGAGEQQTTGQS